MRTFALSGSLFLLGALATGCAPTTSGHPVTTTTDPNASTFEALTPTFTNLAPTTVALGDSVKVFGKDFIDAKHGTLSLHLKGTFKDQDGNETRMNGVDIPLKYVAPGQARFDFGPDVLFSPKGDTIGTFSGNFQVVSTLLTGAMNGQTGDTFISEPQALAMTAGPSIYFDQIRSVDANCQPVTTSTAGNNNIAIGAHLLGVGDATPSDPITYSFSFTSPSLTASYAQNESYGLWPLDPSVPQYATETGTFSFAMEIQNGTSVLVDPQQNEQVVTVSPPVKISQVASNLTSVKLAKLSTGPVDTVSGSYFTLTIKATRSSGTTLSRTMNFPVFNQIEIQPFDGVEVEKLIYPAQMTDTGCFSDGALGGSYTFTEGKSEQRNRTINMSWNINQAVSLGVQTGIALGFGVPGVGSQWNASVNGSDQWSQTFGVDVSKSVSSDTNSSVSGTIPNVLPNYSAASFVQLTTWERSVPVRYHGACGQSGIIATATLVNPKFNHGINQGPTCPPPPPPSIQTPNVQE